MGNGYDVNKPQEKMAGGCGVGGSSIIFEHRRIKQLAMTGHDGVPIRYASQMIGYCASREL